MPKRKVWSPGSIFYIEQQDGLCSIAQVIEVIMTNWVSCAVYEERCEKNVFPDLPLPLSSSQLITVLTVGRRRLDSGAWPVIENQPVALPQRQWPNEKFREAQWVGAKMYDSSILETFLNAYYGLRPWDDSYDPLYFDKLLANPSKKPENLIFEKQQK